ncbi:MAG: class I SAM-dependent methyltransferase [Pseudomonadota bacterium]
MDKTLTELTRKRYDRSAWFYDLCQFPMEHMRLSRWREILWDKVTGRDILEVGVGTGKNLPLYPKDKTITAIDISPKMLARAKRKAKSLGIATRFLEMDVQRLEFEENSFDAIVTTFIFCSVPDPVLGLRELRRVIRPNGHLLMLEHMRPTNAILGWTFDLINPLVVRITGANINRETMKNLQRAGWLVKDQTDIFSDFVKLIEAVPSDTS